jgi:hypothetical protein
MSRRSSLPGADELFRTTSPGGPAGSRPDRETARALPDDPRPGAGGGADDLDALTAAVAALDDAPTAGGTGVRDGLTSGSGDLTAPDGAEGGPRSAVVPVRHTGVRRRPRAVGERRPSGRERHEEKITVYVSAEELMDLEHARLNLRGDHGLAVDRGRIVREALAVVLADLEAKGEASILVRRLTGR